MASAQRWFEMAARWPDYYYGQLALSALGRPMPAFAGLPGWAARLRALEDPAFPVAWAAAAVAWQVEPGPAISGYAWAWIENMVMAAVKAVPLGQAAGQRLLSDLAARVPDRVAAALVLAPEDWSNFQPGLAIASSRHETQYSRLFRS